jgi:hypothetical protein
MDGNIRRANYVVENKELLKTIKYDMHSLYSLVILVNYWFSTAYQFQPNILIVPALVRLQNQSVGWVTQHGGSDLAVGTLDFPAPPST